ncbi:MAG TPA: DUF2062 domain-containing protein [Chitinophagales bacterium]
MQNIRATLIKELYLNSNTPAKILTAVFVGVFIGLSPYHGFKMMIVVGLSFLLKLNRPLTIGLSYIFGFAIFIPFLIFFSHEIGALILQNNNHLLFAHHHKLTLQFVFENIAQQYIGGTVLALVGASLVTFGTFIFLSFRKK